MSSGNKRKELDLRDLSMAGFEVDMPTDDMKEFFVELRGPNDSLYQGGVWRVRVELLDDYPFQSPSVAFSNKIYHPNIHQKSGAVCLNVLNEEWAPFINYLPQLLLNPNPKDPLNTEAANLMESNLDAYENKVKEYCEEYAKPAEDAAEEKGSDDEVSEDEHSSDDDDKADL